MSQVYGHHHAATATYSVLHGEQHCLGGSLPECSPHKDGAVLIAGAHLAALTLQPQGEPG